MVITVATQAGNVPFHVQNLLAYLLHDAACFATDHSMLEGDDRQPYYKRRCR
jgi:hypothetical protein